MSKRTWISVAASGAACAALLGSPAAAGQEPTQVAYSGQFELQVELRLQRRGALTELSLSTGDQPFHTTAATVERPRVIGVPGSPAVLVLWDEVSGASRAPHFALSLDGQDVRRVARADYRLRLAQGEFTPLDEAAQVPDLLAAAPGSQLRLVQFETQTLEEFQRDLERLGAERHAYVANYAYAVRMTPAVEQAVAALPYVRWVGPLHPFYKLDDAVLGTLGTPALPQDQIYNVAVWQRDAKGRVADAIAALGGQVVQPDAGALLIEAALTHEQLLAVVHLDDVHFVDRWGPYEEDMDNVRAIGGGANQGTLHNFLGHGVRGEVIDTGFNVNHADFLGGLIPHGQNPAGSSSHGASTSGIVFGKGLANPSATGMAPAATGLVATWPNPSTGIARYNHTGELVQAPWFAVFQTSSVGSTRTFLYTTISADTDQALFDFDILHLQSQSNASNQDSRPQAWAKNILSVGGINHFNDTNDANDCWGCDFSAGSIGPASDGRLKPDLAHYYDDILTTTCCGATSYTTGFGGTSAATPITAGHAAIFFQMWHQGVFGNPTALSVFDSAPHMTTSKAVLINTATQWSFSGAAHDLTRVHQGWGRADLDNMFELRDKMFVVDETDVLTNLASTAYALTVANNEPALKATLVYADPPGNPSVQAQHRVNDLTLHVMAPDGTQYWGNNGLNANMWSTSGGAANDKDTVENVFVQNPMPGTWTITVSADELNADSHVETGALDADYALVVTGVTMDGVDIYCQAKPSSTGCSPYLIRDGSPSATSTGGFRIRAAGLVPNETGFFIYGINGRSNLNFHNGKLCVKAPVVRLLPAKNAGSGAPPPCSGLITTNFNNRIQNGSDPSLTAGQRVNAQLRQRDPALGDGFNDTLTDGIEFIIQP